MARTKRAERIQARRKEVEAYYAEERVRRLDQFARRISAIGFKERKATA